MSPRKSDGTDTTARLPQLGPVPFINMSGRVASARLCGALSALCAWHAGASFHYHGISLQEVGRRDGSGKFRAVISAVNLKLTDAILKLEAGEAAPHLRQK